MNQHLALFDATKDDTKWFKDNLPDIEISSFEGTIQESDLTKAAAATIIAMHTSSKVDQAVIAALPELKLIACRSTGYDHVDLAAATARRISVATVPSYGENTVAEFAVLLMLALSRKLFDIAAAVDDGQIDPLPLRGHDLAAKNLGVIGTGKIGRHVIKTAKALGMNVIAFDPFPNHEAASELGFEYADLDHLLSQSDIITLHAPSTDENNHLIGTGQIAKMKPSALVINTARGTLVDTEALIEALTSQKLAGAALDVVEGEQLLDMDQELHLLKSHQYDTSNQAAQLSVLKQMPNVILTGHNAYNTAEALERIFQTTAENIKAFIAGQPKNLVHDA